jgi:mono/diheme cytochrome c family protein
MMAVLRRLGVMMLLAGSFAVTGCGGGGSDQSQNKSTDKPKPTTAKATLQAGDATKGDALFVTNCSACHGKDAKGVKGLGRDLTNNEYVQGMSDAEFLDYVIKGRNVDDPRNITGIPMPPKAGNPALKDQEIMHIIAHVRALQ